MKMKARYDSNKINLLYDDQGNKLDNPNAIQDEIGKFSQSLMGNRAHSLPMIDLPTIREGPVLSHRAIEIFNAPVSHKEIDQALSMIADDKAPGIDGFNALLNKRAVVGEAVLDAILSFLNSGSLLREVLYTIPLLLKFPRSLMPQS